MLKAILVLATLAAVAYSQTADPTSINLSGCGTTGSLNRDTEIDENYDPAKIVGGVEAQQHHWRWQVGLQRSGSAICGGSIINSQWIMTAAHCTNGYGASSFTVRVGSHQRSSGGTVHSVSKLIQHSSYSSSTTSNDITLLKLSTPLTFSTRIGPVCLIGAGTATSTLAGKSAIVTGWGTTSSGGSVSTNLRQVAVNMRTDAQCTSAYGSSYISSTMVCAADSGKDSCQGDSGGPLVLNRGNGVYDQIGIVSWGIGCALAAYPGVYTKVAAYTSWVSTTVRAN